MNNYKNEPLGVNTQHAVRAEKTEHLMHTLMNKNYKTTQQVQIKHNMWASDWWWMRQYTQADR